VYFGSCYSCSIEADETESELAAIPESPKSDSTLHGSTHVSATESSAQWQVLLLQAAFTLFLFQLAEIH
jgi:hypothetical protein